MDDLIPFMVRNVLGSVGEELGEGELKEEYGAGHRKKNQTTDLSAYFCCLNDEHHESDRTVFTILALVGSFGIIVVVCRGCCFCVFGYSSDTRRLRRWIGHDCLQRRRR